MPKLGKQMDVYLHPNDQRILQDQTNFIRRMDKIGRFRVFKDGFDWREFGTSHRFGKHWPHNFGLCSNHFVSTDREYFHIDFQMENSTTGPSC